MSESLAAIEVKAKEFDETARKRKQQRYSNAERVLLILKDDDVNALASKYLGEDFTALRAEYQDKVNAVIKLYSKQARMLKKNREKYYKSVAGISEEVDKKNEAANKSLNDSYLEAKKILDNLQRDRKRYNDEKQRLENGLKSTKTDNRLKEIGMQLETLDNQIRSAAQSVSMAKSQKVHLDATLAESFARKKYDTAIEIRQSADNDVHKDIQHESNVFNLATEYENRSLDLIRGALKRRSDIIAKDMNDAQAKLDFIRQNSGNLDFLTAKELESVRTKIAAKLVRGISNIPAQN